MTWGIIVVKAPRSNIYRTSNNRSYQLLSAYNSSYWNSHNLLNNEGIIIGHLRLKKEKKKAQPDEQGKWQKGNIIFFFPIMRSCAMWGPAGTV